MGKMTYPSIRHHDLAWVDCLIAEDAADYHALPPGARPLHHSPDQSESSQRKDSDEAEPDREPVAGPVASRINDAEKLRLAIALVDGLNSAAMDRSANTAFLRNRLAHAVGQEALPEDNETLRNRLKSLVRAEDRNIAEQLQLLVRFDEQKLYRQEGCRSMLVWMGIHLRLGRVSALERLRVGRALSDLPVLSSLFALGQVSFSQLREVTRYATPDTDGEFAIAVLELSVSETIEYCRRFRHVSDNKEDASNAESVGEEEAEARSAMRAYNRRCLSVRDIDAHSTRITLELPNDLASEFLRSLEQVEDWIDEGGEAVEEGVDKTARNTDEHSKSHEGETASTAPIRDTTTSQRRADAAILMSRRSLTLAGKAVSMADRYRVHVNVSTRQLIHVSEGIQNFDPFSNADAGNPLERAQLRGHGALADAAAKRIAAMAGFTVLVSDNHGDITATQKRAAPFSKAQLSTLAARDRCCQVPGCGATRHLHGHHVIHRENGGRSDLSNAALVCSSCHRLLHEGGFRLERVGPKGSKPGPYASQLRHQGKRGEDATARAKINKIRRFRLFGKDGREYGSLGAAWESNGQRVILTPSTRTAAFTRGDTHGG